MAFNPNVSLPGSINQANKTYKGIVVNNKDKTFCRRIQVKIEGCIEGADINDMPWAAPASGQSSGRRADTGCYNIPTINSAVQITFPNGDIYSPQYQDWTDEETDGQIAKLFSEDYPETKGNIEPDGSWERENEKQGYKEYYHRSEFYWKVDKDGNVMVNIPKNLSVFIGEKACVQVEDLISILGNNNLGITISQSIGVDAGQNIGVNAGPLISFDAGHISWNDGLNLGKAIATPAKMVLIQAITQIKMRLAECFKLRTLLKLKGQAAIQAIQDYVDGMLGNRK